MESYTKPHWQTSALIVIDTQNDTLNGQPFEIIGTNEILPAIRKVLIATRISERPIVHIVRLYLSDGSNADICRKEKVERGWHPVSPGSFGSEIPSQLLPSEGLRLDPSVLLRDRDNIQSLAEKEVVIYKPRWGVFYNTSLEHYLRSLDINTLIFAGCNYPNCPRTSIYEASERDFRIVLLTDAISRFDKRGYEEMTGIGISLMTSEEYVLAINSALNVENN